MTPADEESARSSRGVVTNAKNFPDLRHVRVVLSVRRRALLLRFTDGDEDSYESDRVPEYVIDLNHLAFAENDVD